MTITALTVKVVSLHSQFPQLEPPCASSAPRCYERPRVRSLGEPTLLKAAFRARWQPHIVDTQAHKHSTDEILWQAHAFRFIFLNK